jgi:molybdenum cofactor synthesis domain-containing protein
VKKTAREKEPRKKGRKAAPEPTAAAVVIGNELLSGKIADRNLPVLARNLRRLGVRLVRAVTIVDDLDTIAREVRSAAKKHTWVFTSGGVGPTHDDLTIAAVAKAFDVRVVQSPELDDRIRTAYGERLREGHLLMARVPRGARLIKSDAIPWPAVLMNNVWVLPGVPEVFEIKMGLLETVLEARAPYSSIAVYSTLDEGNLKPFLDRVVAAHPAVDVGSYPRWTDPIVRTMITFDGRDRVSCEAAAAAFSASLPEGAVVPTPP